MRPDPLGQLIERMVGRTWLGLICRIWLIVVCVLAYSLPSWWFFYVAFPASILAGVGLFLLHRR